MSKTDDLERLREVYAQRRNSLTDQTRYSVFNAAHLFALQERQRSTIRLFKKNGFVSLTGNRVLEIGCGRGGVLLEYLGYGVSSNKLVGIDLLYDRLIDTTNHAGDLQLLCADGQNLPFQANSFDLVLQYTAFTSVLDSEVRAAMSKEILRVVNPSGMIVWYDFWINPLNPHTKGIRKTEIKQLFPNCDYAFAKITLAPPIARILVPISWMLSLMVENLHFLNTHYLAVIRPR